MKKHLAIFSPEAVEAILSGKKTIESRFSQKKIAPFGKVEVGDLIYIKPSGKDIIGQFKVKKVMSFEGLDKQSWELIHSQYGSMISFGSKKADQAFFDGHKSAKYGTLIFLGSVERFLTSPIKLTKTDLRGWVVLD